MRKYALIVAGGKGLRMNANTPKQFIRIEGVPILIHTIQCFMKVDSSIEMVIVLPADRLLVWEELKLEFPFISRLKIAKGGASRTESVRAGLQLLPDNGIVAIHDAVRPYITPHVIEASFESASKYGSGVAAVPLKDSLRKVHINGQSEAKDRNEYVAVQTPQTFKLNLIKEAYNHVTDECSDDATVFEKAGNSVHLVKGDYANVKITTPEDLY